MIKNALGCDLPLFVSARATKVAQLLRITYMTEIAGESAREKGEGFVMVAIGCIGSAVLFVTAYFCVAAVISRFVRLFWEPGSHCR